MKNAYKSLVRQPEETKPPRGAWENNIKIDLQEMESEDMI
jgi:hypothetical protein